MHEKWREGLRGGARVSGGQAALDKMPGVFRDALGQMMDYVVIVLCVVPDHQVCGPDAQVTVAEGERKVPVATGSQVSGKQHPAWGGAGCGQTAGPWEGGLEVECSGTGNGRAEAEKISADPGDRWLEENLERETEPAPETLNTLNVPSWLHRVVWNSAEAGFQGGENYLRGSCQTLNRRGPGKRVRGEEGDDDRITSVAGGSRSCARWTRWWGFDAGSSKGTNRLKRQFSTLSRHQNCP